MTVLQIGFFPKQAIDVKRNANLTSFMRFYQVFQFFSFLLYTHIGTWIFGPNHWIVLEKLHKYSKFQVRYLKFVSNIPWSNCDIIYKLTDWMIMIHGNWKDHNYFGLFHGNCKHYNDHVLSHGNCKNHNDLGFSMGIVGITIIFLCFVAYNYHGKNQNNCDTYNYHVKFFFLLSVDNFQYLRKAKWW